MKQKQRQTEEEEEESGAKCSALEDVRINDYDCGVEKSKEVMGD